MRFIIGIIIFWLTIFGIKFFLEDKLKLDNKFSFASSFTMIGIVEFIFGILNIMKIGSLVLVIFFIMYLVYKLIKKELKKENILLSIKNPTNIICFLVFLYITIISLRMHITHYDNFSHWGLIVKTMFQFNRLPNFENNYLFFKGYQPGSACFIYFFGLLSGKNEATMIIAHNYLIFSYLTVLFNYIGKNKKILKSILIICFYIFIMTTSKISFNNLLVDSLLSVQFIFGAAIIYNYRDDIKKATIYLLPIAIYLLMVKNTGLVLDGMLCLYIFYLALKEKKLKIGIKCILLIGICLVTTVLIWQKHVSLVYGQLALESKHSLSLQNISSSLKDLGTDNLILFIKMYTKHLFSLKKNHPNIYLLIFNVIGLMQMFIEKDKKKIIKYMLLLNTIYFGYYLILGAMYILSMPWEEAKVFASYDRYMMTIINIIIGLFIIGLFVTDNYKNFKQLIYTVIVSISLLIPIHFEYKIFSSLIGNDHYKGTSKERFDMIQNRIPLDKDVYYIYAPSSSGDYGLLYHMGLYELQKEHIYVLQKEKDINNIENDSYIILFDELDNYDELFNDDYVRINDVVLSKEDA